MSLLKANLDEELQGHLTRSDLSGTPERNHTASKKLDNARLLKHALHW